MSGVQRTLLENGVRVVTDSMPGARSVSVGVVVDVGSASERSPLAGTSHLCEHLLFQGTSNRNALEIARLIDGAGGHVGGFTSRDYTCFHGVVQAEFQTFVLDLLGDIILNPVFPQEALEREQRAILCEIEATTDDPEELAHQVVKELAWQGDALGRPIAGEASDVAALTREDLIYFVHSHYLPERIIVAAAGQLNHEDFVAHVRDAFWRLLPAEEPAETRSPARFNSGVRLVHRPVSQAYFSLAFDAPAYAAADRYHAHLFSQILGGGLSSRLFNRLREREGLVYSAATTYHAYRRGGMLMVEASTAPQHLMKVLHSTLEELTGLGRWTVPPDAEELQRGKARLRGQIVLASEDSHSRMSRVATQELYFGNSLSEEHLLEEIEALDAQSFEQWIETSLQGSLDRVAAGLVAPEAPAHYDQEQIESLFHSFGVLPSPDRHAALSKPGSQPSRSAPSGPSGVGSRPH